MIGKGLTWTNQVRLGCGWQNIGLSQELVPRLRTDIHPTDIEQTVHLQNSGTQSPLHANRQDRRLKHTLTHNRFTALFRDHPGEPVPEDNFWTLWYKGRLTEADTPTIRLGAAPSELTSAHLHHPPHIFLQAECPSCHPTNSVKALKATSAIRLGRRR